MTSTPPPPPPAGPGAMDGFFDSLRRMNLPRSQERWIGGVAGGIGARLGIDPLIVRGVFLVITLFGGLGLLVYGLAWALLPEAADGRIHLQEAIRGRFDAALVGAIVFTVIGLSRVGFWWDGWFGIPYMIGMVALVALVVVVVAAVRSSGSSGPSTTHHGQGGSAPFPTTHPGQGGSAPFPTTQHGQGGSAPFPTTHPGQGGSAPYAGGTGGVAGAQGAPGQQPAPGPAVSGPWAEGPWPAEDAASGATAHTSQGPGPEQAAEEDAAIGAADPPTESDDAAERPGAAGPATAAYGTDPTTAYPAADTTAHGQGSWSTGQDAWSTAGHDAWSTGQGAWSTAPAGAPPTPPAPTPAPPAQPPRPPKPARPGPGRVLVRLTFGLALLALAALVLAGEYFGWSTSPWLIALGGALVVLGLGATVAGLLGRRSASLGVVGTLLAIVLVPWAITSNMFAGFNFADTSSYGTRYWTPQSAAEAAAGYNLAAGGLEVDLSDLAEETVSTPIDIDVAAGYVVLLVPDEMPVTVTATVQGEATAVNLSGWTAEVNGERRALGDHTDFGWLGTRPMTAELASPEAAGADPLEVEVDVAFGSIEVRELP